MAPEQILRETVTRQTDIYAAAVVLWEVLTGARLHGGEDDAGTLFSALSSSPAAPSALAPNVPASLDAVVFRGLLRDRTSRFATAHEMALALRACAPPAAPPEVASFVEGLACDALSERAREIAELEAAAALPDAQPPDATPEAHRRSTFAIGALAAALVVAIVLSVGARSLTRKNAPDRPEATAAVTRAEPSPTTSPSASTSSTATSSPPAASVPEPRPAKRRVRQDRRARLRSPHPRRARKCVPRATTRGTSSSIPPACGG
jgi:serine/threonine-protein kinase